MKDHPILYSAPMVRAILDGRKTQTRRIVKYNSAIGGIHPAVASIVHRGDGWFGFEAGEAIKRQYATTFPLHTIRCPYGQSGDRLWVKENHRLLDCTCTETCRVPGKVFYEADLSGYDGCLMTKLRPSIFMPRWASRLTLEITDIKVERLQDISDEDAKAEGIEWGRHEPKLPMEGFKIYNGAGITNDPRLSYRSLWESINGPGSWDINPWVWALIFRRVV